MKVTYSKKRSHFLRIEIILWVQCGFLEFASEKVTILYFFPVTNRSEENLIKIILRFIRPRSIIYSDCFSSYVNNRSFPKKLKLDQYEYIHNFINHKKEFVSPLFKNIDTNNVENLWKQVKKQIRKDGVTRMFVPALARFYFLKTLCNEEQNKIIKKEFQSKVMKSKEDLINSILTKYWFVSL